MHCRVRYQVKDFFVFTRSSSAFREGKGEDDRIFASIVRARRRCALCQISPSEKRTLQIGETSNSISQAFVPHCPCAIIGWRSLSSWCPTVFNVPEAHLQRLPCRVLFGKDIALEWRRRLHDANPGPAYLLSGEITPDCAGSASKQSTRRLAKAAASNFPSTSQGRWLAARGPGGSPGASSSDSPPAASESSSRNQPHPYLGEAGALTFTSRDRD